MGIAYRAAALLLTPVLRWPWSWWDLAVTDAAVLPACCCAANNARFCCCLQTANKWQSWAQTLGPVQISADAKFSDIIVPTKDSARYTFLLDIALKHGHPILFVGPTGQRPCLPPNSCSSQLSWSGPLDNADDPLHGPLSTNAAQADHQKLVACAGDMCVGRLPASCRSCLSPAHVPAGTGKSTYINRHLVQGLPKESWAPIFVTFSARTSANMTQEQASKPLGGGLRGTCSVVKDAAMGRGCAPRKRGHKAGLCTSWLFAGTEC